MPETKFDLHGIASRIRERLDEIGSSARKVSLESGRGSDLIRNVLRAADRGRAYHPRVDTLSDIAKVLNVEQDWLAFGRGPKTSDTKDASPASPAEQADWPSVPIVGAVEAGVFRATELYKSHPRRPFILAPDPRYPTEQQYCWEVRGDSMNLAGILEGAFLVGVEYKDYARRYGSIKDGSIVIVERTRDAGAEVEWSAKEAKVFPDRIELQPRSSNPAHKSLTIPRDGGEDGPIRIAAVVTRAFQAF